MTKRKIFFSFCFKKDVMRVEQIRNIAALEENIPVSRNDWEIVKMGQCFDKELDRRKHVRPVMCCCANWRGNSITPLG